MSSAEVHLSWEASVGGSRLLAGAAATTSAAAVASQSALHTARSSGNPPGFLSVAGAGVDDGSFALPVIHPLSMTRRGLDALRRVTQAVAESSAPPAHMSGTRRLSHHP